MKPVDLIITVVVLLILLAAGLLIRRAKKRGKKCIGCPEGGCGVCSGCRESE